MEWSAGSHGKVFQLTRIESGGFLNVFPADQLDTAPFNNSVLVESAWASQLGLTDQQPRFRYRVSTTGSSQAVSETGWILFDAAHPTLDTALSGWEGTPLHPDGEPLVLRLDREAATHRQMMVGNVSSNHA